MQNSASSQNNYIEVEVEINILKTIIARHLKLETYLHREDIKLIKYKNTSFLIFVFGYFTAITQP